MHNHGHKDRGTKYKFLNVSSSKMFLCPDGGGRAAKLVQWTNPRDSAIVFGTVLAALVACRYVSLLSVSGNAGLALLAATMAFRIYRSVLAAVNKSGEGNPFKVLLILSVPQ